MPPLFHTVHGHNPHDGVMSGGFMGSVATVRVTPDGGSAKHGLTLEEKLAQGLIRVQEVKPAIRTDASKMRAVARGEAEVPVAEKGFKIPMQIATNANGDTVITIPNTLKFSEGRDTKSPLQRNFYFMDLEGFQWEGFIDTEDGEDPIPVTYNFTTGISVKSNVRVVSAE